jgi:hypothetical protein
MCEIKTIKDYGLQSKIIIIVIFVAATTVPRQLNNMKFICVFV